MAKLPRGLRIGFMMHQGVGEASRRGVGGRVAKLEVHLWPGVLVLTAHRQPRATVHQRGNERMVDGGEGRGGGGGGGVEEDAAQRIKGRNVLTGGPSCGLL